MSDGNVAIERVRGVAHSCNSSPLRLLDMRLADALVFCLVRPGFCPVFCPSRDKYFSFASQEYGTNFDEICGCNHYHYQTKRLHFGRN